MHVILFLLTLTIASSAISSLYSYLFAIVFIRYSQFVQYCTLHGQCCLNSSILGLLHCYSSAGSSTLHFLPYNSWLHESRLDYEVYCRTCILYKVYDNVVLPKDGVKSRSMMGFLSSVSRPSECIQCMINLQSTQ